MELSTPTNTLVISSGKTVSFVPLVPNQFQTHTVTLPHAPSSASLHPILGDRFVAGSTSDPWVRVYGFQNGEEREVYKGHHGPVHCVEYSPDGEMYASGSGEFSFNLWFNLSRLTVHRAFRGWNHTTVADNSWYHLWVMARGRWGSIAHMEMYISFPIYDPCNVASWIGRTHKTSTLMLSSPKLRRSSPAAATQQKLNGR